MQVNFLSHWLLAHELLSEQRKRRAKQAKKGKVLSSSSGSSDCSCGLEGTRLVMLSSLTHHAGPLNWEDKQVIRWSPVGLTAFHFPQSLPVYVMLYYVINGECLGLACGQQEQAMSVIARLQNVDASCGECYKQAATCCCVVPGVAIARATKQLLGQTCQTEKIPCCCCCCCSP